MYKFEVFLIIQILIRFHVTKVLFLILHNINYTATQSFSVFSCIGDFILIFSSPFLGIFSSLCSHEFRKQFQPGEYFAKPLLTQCC